MQTIRSHLHINNGNKTFTASTPFEHLAGGNPIVSDFNNDGHDDVFIPGYKDANDSNNSENYMSLLYLGNGNGGFSAQEITFPWESVSLRGHGTDLDNDGNMDIVFQRQYHDDWLITEVRVVRGNGNGTFSEISTGLPNFGIVGGFQTQDVDFADIDGNGYNDILYGGFGLTRLFLNHGNFTFEEVVEPIRNDNNTSPFPESPFVSYAFGYVNDDELIDFVISSIIPDGHTVFYLNNGDNTFTQSQVISHESKTLFNVYFHDFNGDGFSEVFSSSCDLEHYWDEYDLNDQNPDYFWSSLYWVEYGIFGEYNYIKLFPALDGGVNSCIAADFDNDGDDDLLYIGRHTGGDGAGAGLYWNDIIEMTTEESNYKEFIIYLNPTKGIINFTEIIKEISVYDLSGNLVKTQNGLIQKIDISVLPKGNYLIKGVTETGKPFAQKIIKD